MVFTSGVETKAQGSPNPSVTARLCLRELVRAMIKALPLNHYVKLLICEIQSRPGSRFATESVAYTGGRRSYVYVRPTECLFMKGYVYVWLVIHKSHNSSDIQCLNIFLYRGWQRNKEIYD